MVLRTKIEVECNLGAKPSQRTTAKVDGQIGGTMWNPDFSEIGFNWHYSLAVGATPIGQGYFVMKKEEINAMYDQIKEHIPKEGSYTEQTEFIVYMGFRVMMAADFGCTTEDIEIL